MAQSYNVCFCCSFSVKMWEIMLPTMRKGWYICWELEKAKLCLGCGINFETCQKEKAKWRPVRPSTFHIDLVLQVVVLILSSRTETHFGWGREPEESSTLPKGGTVGQPDPALLGLSEFIRTAERRERPSSRALYGRDSWPKWGRSTPASVPVKIGLSSFLWCLFTVTRKASRTQMFGDHTSPVN